MTSEHKIFLPDAPAPAAEAREVAIATALERLDAKNRAGHQGSAHDGHLMRQTAIPPSRRRSVMPRARYAIAASLVALMAGSASWIFISERPLIREDYSLRDAAPPQPEIITANRLPAQPPTDVEASRVAPAPNVSPPAPAAQPAPPALAKTEAPAAEKRAVATQAPAKALAERDLGDGAKQAYGRPAAPKPAAEAHSGVHAVFGPRRQDAGSSAGQPGARPAPAPGLMPPSEPAGHDQFSSAPENAFKSVREAPASTYASLRASLDRNVLPRAEAVRTWELVNSFPYAYAAPESASEPLRPTVSVFPSPWAAGHKIVHIGLKGYAARPADSGPIAEDVKIEVAFNPATVAEFRLIGDEARPFKLSNLASDLRVPHVSPGWSLTALYEIVPVDGPRVVEMSRAQPSSATAPPASATEYGSVTIRYKLPASDISTLISTPIGRATEYVHFEDAPNEARFATGVAAFGEILRGGRHTGTFTYDDVLRIATPARGDDAFGYRAEFLQLVRAAKTASAMPALRR